jgi:hypothetical protein
MRDGESSTYVSGDRQALTREIEALREIVGERCRVLPVRGRVRRACHDSAPFPTANVDRCVDIAVPDSSNAITVNAAFHPELSPELLHLVMTTAAEQ